MATGEPRAHVDLIVGTEQLLGNENPTAPPKSPHNLSTAPYRPTALSTQQSTELHRQHSSHLRTLMVPGRFSSLPSAYPLLPKNTKVFLSSACGLFLTQ